MTSTTPTRWIFLLAIAFCPLVVHSATTVATILPAGFQRGKDVIVVMFGAELTDPQDIVFYRPGVELLELEAIAHNKIKAHIRIAADCPIGPIPFRVATGRGISNLRLFSVTALPCMNEVEPEKGKEADPLVGTDVPRNVTMLGILQPEDVDSFCVDLKAGEPLSYELEGLRIGRVEMDAEIEIADPDGKIVAKCDDTSLTARDPAGVYIAKTAGKHTIRLREARRIGGGAYQYLFHIGKFPRPMMGLPGSGRPGEELSVTWVQADGETWEQKVKLPADAHGTQKVYASNEHGIAPTANEFRIVDLPITLEAEPNSQVAAPQEITIPTAVVGVLSEDGDEDFFQFSAKKGEKYDFRVFGRRFLRSPIDALLRIRLVRKGQIASADDINGPDCMIEFTAPEDGEYTAYVGDHLAKGGPQYRYRLEIAKREPSLKLGSPERVYRLDPSVNLARGNRMAVLINVKRNHFDEHVELDWKDLPAGLDVDAPAIPKGQDRIPVVFHVQKDAQRGGHLLAVAGRAKVGEETIEGPYHQRTMLVRGQNNRDVWGYDADRLAVAVTDESVFAIDAQVPTVPLVRNGSLPLMVRVNRYGDFKGEVKLNLLHTPPGVSAQRDVMLPADKDVAEIILTANGGAQLATTPIVVTAEATHNSISYITSSHLTDLRVEDSIFSVAFEKASVEQGKNTEMIVKVTKKRDYEGKVVAELVGLPSGATSSPQDVPADAEEIKFSVAATEKARPGRFNTVICQLRVLPKPDATPAESILHVLGTGQLRIDKPLTPKKTPEKSNPKPAATAQAKAE